MADDDDQRRGSDAGRGKRSVLRRGMSAVASVGRAMLPSSSSSRPPPLTQDDISQMSAEELIALVEDDERMLKLIQDKGLKRKLRSCIEQLGDEGTLLPNRDQAANDDFSDELTQRIANFKDTATIWEPSSSSSRPTSLTPGVISQMSAEELIALVEDDERMLELIQDDEIKNTLVVQIIALATQRRLLPGESKKENNAYSDELLQRIANFKDTATIWDHFAQDPARIVNTQTGSTLKRVHEDVENEDDPDREDSYDGGTKRFAVSQSAAESSAQSKTLRGRKTPSSQKSQATTEVPEYFMPLYAEAWEIEKDEESAAAIELFSGKRAMFIEKCYALSNPVYYCFPEARVHGYMLKILGYILNAGMMKVLPSVITDADPGNMVIDADMEATIRAAGCTFHRKVDVQISFRNGEEERLLGEEIEELENLGENKTKQQQENLGELDDKRKALLNGAFLTVLECKTPKTFNDDPIQLINEFYSLKWAPSNKKDAKTANPKRYEDFEQVINSIGTRESLSRNAKTKKTQNNRYIGSPVAQLCLYMISTAVDFGALTNGPATYFIRRNVKARTVDVSEAFYSNRNDNEGRANPGNWSLGQAWLVFLYHALKNHVPKREKDYDWLSDGSESTEGTIQKIKDGDINVSASVQEKPSSEGSSGASTNNSTSRNGNSRRASGSRNRGRQRNTTVFAMFRLGPNLETPNMRDVLGGKAVGYPDIMINGVSSFVKTTYALHDSAYALGHEGKVYAALHALQGDVVPRVTACGLDETLNLVVFATEQCGKSLCDLYTRELEEHGGLEELYWKAALALDKIHKAGFIHGDVALRNIVVDDASNVKFIDLERSKKSRSKALREEDFNLLADAFGIDSAKDFRTLSRTNNTEAHLENNEIVQ